MPLRWGIAVGFYGQASAARGTESIIARTDSIVVQERWDVDLLGVWVFRLPIGVAQRFVGSTYNDQNSTNRARPCSERSSVLARFVAELVGARLLSSEFACVVGALARLVTSRGVRPAAPDTSCSTAAPVHRRA
jgi:hypothetical protein